MSRKHKVTRIVIGVLLAALVAGGAYMLRPVGIYDLFPDLEIDRIDVNMLAANIWMDSRELKLEPGDPAFDEVLSQVEALRFNRSPLNPLLQALPFLGRLDLVNTVKTTEGYEVGDMYLYFTRENEDGTAYHAGLDLWVDAWSYWDTDHNVQLTITPVDEEAALALVHELWELAGEQEATP